MTLVGPRPIVADELERYGRHAECYLELKPGLTGLWQVTRDAETSYRRRVATDVLYRRKRSLALDLRIILMTVPAVLFGSGTG
jgi:lipopolysaccharide/colanic/teichoic acid biosynthesis glycosyltransferase